LRQQAVAAGKKQLAGILPEVLPRRLIEALLALAGIDSQQRAAELSKAGRLRLVQLMKRNLVPVSGTMGFKKAEVTAGGVCLDEVDSRTMQSKLVSGLYLAGEVLDLDGPIGGYNFQAAFSTGCLAGESV
jgi:predicted Rossmann fold flavoprotein